MLSPLAGGRPQIKMETPNPLLKASFGRKGLAPLGANRNLANEFNDNNNNDPLLRSLKKKKPGLAPMGIAQINMRPEPSEGYQSPIIKCRVGANRIISPMASKQNDVPMQLMGVSRTNLSHTLRKPKGVATAAPLTPKSKKGKKLLNIDGAFPDDDTDDTMKVNGVNGVDFQRTLRDTNMLMETGHRMKNMIAPEAPGGMMSPYALSSARGGADSTLRMSKRRARLQQEQDHDPWSTTTGSSYVY